MRWPSVTARHMEFLYGRTKVENMRDEVRDIFRRIQVEDAELLARLADGPLPPTDDDKTGEDVG